MPFTTSTNLGGPGGSLVVPPFWVDFMRGNLYPSLYFRQLGTQITIPRGYGSAAKIPRWKSPFTITGATSVSGTAGLSAGKAPTAVKVSLTEGSVFNAASARALCAESISGATIQFGGVRAYSDKVILVSHANFVEGALESLVRELAFKIDRWTRQQITAGATLKSNLRPPKINSTSAAVIQANSLIGKNVARIAPFLDASMTPRWPDMTFPMLIHPLAQFDIWSDISANGFVSVARYNDAQNIYRGEIGQMYGIRFLITNSLPIYIGTAAASAANGISGNATGTNAYVVAPDPYYVLELEDGGMEVIHHPPGSSGSVSDALNQFGSVGVKIHYGIIPAPVIDKRIIRWAHTLGAGY